MAESFVMSPLSDETSDEEIIDFLRCLTWPIHDLGEETHAVLSKPAMALLADKFGSELEALWIEVPADVAVKDLMNLLSRCPLLEQIELHQNVSRSLLEDDDLLQLSGFCPKLNALRLGRGSAKNITDSGLVKALKRWPLICDLQLIGCNLLTDAAVPQILQCLPDLEMFNVGLCNISKECMLTVTLHPSRLTDITPSTSADKVWIEQELKGKNLDWKLSKWLARESNLSI